MKIENMDAAQRRELLDLCKLAVERSRKSVLSVIQLMEDEYLASAVITTVAVDCLVGAQAYMMDATGKSKEDAINLVLAGVLLKLEDADLKKVARLMREQHHV